MPSNVSLNVSVKSGSRPTSIILGSSSPRRQDLLRQAGFEFIVMKPDTPELVRKGESPASMVKRLSLEKAEAILERVLEEGDREDFVIVAADTTVVSPSGKEVLNKPEDRKDAVRILKKIQGKKHTVLTAYTILGRTGKRIRKVTRMVKTRVQIRPLDRATIESYINTGEPMDKAGAYAAQGIGMGFIAGIQGSYTNVVGLPMSELLSDLESSFKLRPRWKIS